MLHFGFTTNKKGMQHMSITLNHFDENLKQFLMKKITPQVLTRLAIVLLNLLGIKSSEISKVLKCCEKTVAVTIKKYKSNGLMNILEKPRVGRKSFLTDQESSKIKNEVICKNSCDSFCKKINIRKVKPRPVHKKNDPEIM